MQQRLPEPQTHARRLQVQVAIGVLQQRASLCTCLTGVGCMAGYELGIPLPMMYVPLTVNLCHGLHPVWSCESTVSTDDVSVATMHFHDQSEQHGHAWSQGRDITLPRTRS